MTLLLSRFELVPSFVNFLFFFLKKTIGTYMYLHIRTCTLVVCFRFLLGNGILCKIVLTIKGDKAPHHHCPLSLSLVTMTHQHDSSVLGRTKHPIIVLSR